MWLDIMQTPKTTAAGKGGQPSKSKRFTTRLCLAVLLATALLTVPARAGVTVITHGWQPTVLGYPTWVDSMAQAATNAANARGLKSSWYHLTVTGNMFTGLDATMEKRSVATAAETPEILLTVDWSDVADHLVGDGNTVTTADVASWVSGGLRTAYPSIGLTEPLASRSLHLVGHSRGGSVSLETARLLGMCGIWVDQITTLDPHPLALPDGGVYPSGLHFGDPAVRLYDNVIFADNYWRTDDGLGNLADFNGQAIPGAYNVRLNEYILEQTSGAEHSKVHTWYHGTIGIDPNFPTGDPEISVIPANWYSGESVTVDGVTQSLPHRDDSGFALSVLSPRHQDLRQSARSGLGQSFGGSGARDATTHSASQWANLGFIELTGYPDNRIPQGKPIRANYKYQAHNTALDIRWYLDDDTNPNNNAGSFVSASQLAATGDKVVADSVSISTAGFAPGIKR